MNSLSYLGEIESEAIYVIREVAASCKGCHKQFRN